MLNPKRLTSLLLAAPLLLASANVLASSHREAPGISKDPFADNTDTYVFLSPANQDNIVLMASWIPFEGPEGGPNYFEWDDNNTYIIHVDSNGDGAPNWTYRLNSRTILTNPNTFLFNTGPITALDAPGRNRQQFITVTETAPDGSVTTLVDDQLTTPTNIGSKSTPDYQSLVEQATYSTSIPQFGPNASGTDTLTIYGGQTDDPFFVDLQVFDLLTLRGEAAPVGYSTGNNTPVDAVTGFNVHTLVIEMPSSRLARPEDPVIGVWSTTEKVATGTQVSRLGLPLVNELVIQLPIKDAFNGLAPVDDITLYFNSNLPGGSLQSRVENPEVSSLLCALYGVPLPDDADNDCSSDVVPGSYRSTRGDIVDIFLQGLVLAAPFTINTAGGPVTLPAGFNVNRPTNPEIVAGESGQVTNGVQPAEMIRINTAIKGDTCAPTPHPLGILGGDACGYPNGRRLADDVVDIDLLAVAGAAYAVLDGRDASFSFNADLIDVLTDNINGNDLPFPTRFPYLPLAHSGQERVHDNPGSGPTVPPTPTAPPAPTVTVTGTGDGGGGAFGLVSILGLFGVLIGAGLRRQRGA